MEQMEQMQVSEDMRRSTLERIDALTLAQARDILLSVVKSSDDPHLLAQVYTTATTIAVREKRERDERIPRRAYPPIHNPDGDHTWDRSRGYTGAD